MKLVEVKKLFFDKAAVTSRLDPAKKRALSKFGAFVRQRSRTSMRTRPGASAPGSPPHAHTKKLRDAILFAYDPGNESVVIGPHRADKTGEGARVQEEGGVLRVGRVRGGRALRYPARPYMRPAFLAELPRAAEQLKGVLR